jgi:hypothetical protein
MKSFFTYSAVLFAGLVLEGVLQHFPFVTVRFDVGLILILYAGFFLTTRTGALVVLLTAFIQESVSAPFHGPKLLASFSVFLVIRAARRQIFFQGGWSQVTWVAFLSLAVRVCEILFLRWKGYPAIFGVLPMITASVFQGFLSLAIFPLLEKKDRSVWKEDYAA